MKKSNKSIIISILVFFLILLLLFHPFIPVIIVSGNGLGYERSPKLLTNEFVDRLDTVLDDYEEFHFRIGNIIFITSFLFYDEDIMWKYTNEAS